MNSPNRSATRPGGRVIVQLLDSSSPYDCSFKRSMKALRWVRNWGCSDPETVNAVAGDRAGKLCARLLEKGLLASHATPKGGPLGMPQKFVVLTRQAVEWLECERAAGDMLGYATHGAQPVRLHQLHHELLVQRITAKRLLGGKIAGYLTPRQFAASSGGGVKQPDAIWIQKDGTWVAMELESPLR